MMLEEFAKIGAPTALAALEAKATLPTASVEQANAVLAKAEGLSIRSDEDYVVAADFARDCKAAGEREDKNRVEMKADFLAGCQKIDSYFRGPIAIYERAFKAVKARMVDYDDRKRQEREAQEKRLMEERRRTAAEAQARIQAEEEARREAQAAADREARAKLEAAEANARREREARLEAEARSRGDAEAAAKANERAKDAEKEAALAKEQARADREAAIEAKRRELRAQAEAEKATSTAQAAQESAPAEAVKAGGVARKVVWKWRLREGKLQADIPRKWLMLDAAAVQTVIDKVKDKDLAEQLLGDCFEVYSEADLAIGKKRGS